MLTWSGVPMQPKTAIAVTAGLTAGVLLFTAVLAGKLSWREHDDDEDDRRPVPAVEAAPPEPVAPAVSLPAGMDPAYVGELQQQRAELQAQVDALLEREATYRQRLQEANASIQGLNQTVGRVQANAQAQVSQMQAALAAAPAAPVAPEPQGQVAQAATGEMLAPAAAPAQQPAASTPTQAKPPAAGAAPSPATAPAQQVRPSATPTPATNVRTQPTPTPRPSERERERGRRD